MARASYEAQLANSEVVYTTGELHVNRRRHEEHTEKSMVSGGCKEQ